MKLHLFVGVFGAATTLTSSPSAPLVPFKSCIPVAQEERELGAALCEEYGMQPCAADVGIELLFSEGVTKNPPDRNRCFGVLTVLQTAISCEYVNRPQVAFFEPDGEGVKIQLCRDVCHKIWEACSESAASLYASLLAEHDPIRFCNKLGAPNRGLQFQAATAFCLSANHVPMAMMDVQREELAWKMGMATPWDLLLDHWQSAVSLGILNLLLLALLTASCLAPRGVLLECYTKTANPHVYAFVAPDDCP